MKMSALLSRRGHDLPGVIGTARIVTPGSGLPRKLGAKDIVIADLNRMDADSMRRIVEAQVAMVVHAPRVGEQMIPRTSYRVLAASTLPVVEIVGADEMVDNGTRVRVEDGRLFRLEDEIAAGRVLEAGDLLEEADNAETALVSSAQAHYSRAAEFLSLEHPLLLDGEGVPELDVDVEGRHVLVITGDRATADQLAELKPFIREYRPVVVAVDHGADLALEAKFTPDVIVADPTTASREALTSGASLVIPADRDGRCEGLDIIAGLGVGGTTFPAAATARDLALLWAHHAGARMIVVTGEDYGLVDAFSGPSQTIVDRSLAAKLVHANACASLYRSAGTGVWVALLVLVALVAVAAAVVAQGSLDELTTWFVQTWNGFALWVQGLFS